MPKENILEKGAIVQRDRETYSVSPHIAGGFCKPEMLRKIADIAEKYEAKYVKLTGSQRIALMGVREDDIDKIWDEFGDPKKAIGPSVRSIKVCPGTLMCKRAVQDSAGLGLALDQAFYGQPTPAKFKMGVSGCPNCCSDSWMKDVGFFGSAKGFKVTVGGKGGGAPRIGTELADGVSAEEAVRLVGRILELYRKEGIEKERIGKFIDRIGMERFKEIVLDQQS